MDYNDENTLMAACGCIHLESQFSIFIRKNPLKIDDEFLTPAENYINAKKPYFSKPKNSRNSYEREVDKKSKITLLKKSHGIKQSGSQHRQEQEWR